MNARTPGTLAVVGLGIGLLFWPRGMFMGEGGFWGPGHPTMFVAMEALVFCVVYFGTLKFWELLTGDKLQRPLPAILALWLGIRLTVDCARVMRWW